VVTGATSITSTAFVGALTGNASGTAATVTGAAQTNITSLGTLTALTVDDVAVDGKVVTMTGSACDTVVMTAATNGAFSLVTTDTAAAAANIQITADGTVDIDSAGVLTLDSGAAINIEPASGSAVLIDGTVSIDGAAITGATSILATDIKIGEDDETKVDFACANIINLHANNIKAASLHNTSSKGDLRLYEACNYVSITTPALSANWTLTLPANDGCACQVLKTNGSGVTSWAAAGGDVVCDTSPQLGGALDAQNNAISNIGAAGHNIHSTGITITGDGVGIFTQGSTNAGVTGIGAFRNVTVGPDKKFSFQIPDGALFVVQNGGVGYAGLFFAQYTSATVEILGGCTGQFTLTSSDEGKINIYKGINTSTAWLENRTTTSYAFRVLVLGGIATGTAVVCS
jgi:hypothetical protein